MPQQLVFFLAFFCWCICMRDKRQVLLYIACCQKLLIRRLFWVWRLWPWTVRTIIVHYANSIKDFHATCAFYSTIALITMKSYRLIAEQADCIPHSNAPILSLFGRLHSASKTNFNTSRQIPDKFYECSHWSGRPKLRFNCQHHLTNKAKFTNQTSGQDMQHTKTFFNEILANKWILKLTQEKNYLKWNILINYIKCYSMFTSYFYFFNMPEYFF